MSKKNNDGWIGENLMMFLKGCWIILKYLWRGISATVTGNMWFQITASALVLICYLMVYKRWIFFLFEYFKPSLFGHGFYNRSAHFNFPIIAMILITVVMGIYFLFIGAVVSRDILKYQKLLDLMRFKSGEDRSPKVIGVEKEGSDKVTVKILSVGVGVDNYQRSKCDLEAAFGIFIDKICTGKEPRFIEIHLSKRRVPEKCYYSDYEDRQMAPYSFVVGESLNGVITKKITDLPHMLIAGTTGGGKSVFFKQVILWLLKTSPKMQMYLLDLKNGLEMKNFEPLPNVKVCKDVATSLQTLTVIDLEMKNRFQYLESKGFKEVVPERDKLDRLVICVDEASMLYGLVSRHNNDYNSVTKAREITDRIAKLGRAAGIHLILATQKITKETIGTSIQENVTGRMCFRMNTQQGSQVVLGDKSAMKLPENPGRAIWQSGTQRFEVQAPYLTEEEIDEYVDGRVAIQEQKNKSEVKSTLEVTKVVNEKVVKGFADSKERQKEEINEGM